MAASALQDLLFTVHFASSGVHLHVDATVILRGYVMCEYMMLTVLRALNKPDVDTQYDVWHSI
jgi:hypothetical protein